METSTHSSHSNTSDFGRLVWISDQKDGFVAARITDISQNGFTVVTEGTNQTVVRRYEETFACEEDPRKSVEDNCALVHLNEATLLNNCRLRYADRKIYSYVANILIAINPYQPIEGLYSSEKIAEYRGKSVGQKEPHIFAIADKAYREMRRSAVSQTIIVSGESGAGKTESQKAVLRFVCENWGRGAGPIQQRLLEANPILEAFGNAKTLRNNNSSRFGKFVQIHFDEKGTVAGGFVSHYLLETSRVCRQSSGERNYHIFYQLIAGSSDELFKSLELDSPEHFNYLKHGSNLFFVNPNEQSSRFTGSTTKTDTVIHDISDFSKLKIALKSAGIEDQTQSLIWNTVAGILHLGNIAFEENVDDSKGGCKISKGAESSLTVASRLLGLNPEELKLGLTARIMQATKGGGVKGTVIRVPLKVHEANGGRDALAKAVYSRLFDWLISKVNERIQVDKRGGSSRYIGVLDIAGFEFFASNSFEQFCINYCNEKLQHFFNEHILRQEQDLYREEKLKVRKIDFIDNQDCIELFERKINGLFELLDEEAKLPRASFQNFTKKAHEQHRNHFRIDTPRKSKIKSHREMRDEEGFLIRHYAGSVCYETRHFLEKNNDQLHNSLEFLVDQSRSPLILEIFGATKDDEEKQKQKEKPRTSGKLKSQTVGAKFKSQLGQLLEKLNTTETHFVRCIKPNNEMKAWFFDGNSILGQLECAGMGSVLRLMQEGFPSRTSFADLYKMYEKSLPANLARLDPRLFSKCLFRALGLDEQHFQFGETKVFFKAGKFAEFDQMMKQDPETMKYLIEKVNDWLIKARWRKAQYGVWEVIKLKNKILYRAEKLRKIQAGTRGYLIRKRFVKRLTIYRKACALLEHSREMADILARMNSSSQDKWTKSSEATTSELEQLVQKIRSSEDLESEVEHAVKCYEQLVLRVDAIIQELRQQLESDELAKVEQKRKEDEEKEKLEKEEKAAMEKERINRRKMEEDREKAQKEYEQQLALRMKKEDAELEKQRLQRDQEERERLDTVTSARLATSDGVLLAPVELQLSGSGSASSKSSSSSKFDLGNWKYADLRDAINTSNDMELLIACKEEFHRRLRIYNEWKTRNSANRDVPPTRAPLAVFTQQKASSSSMMARAPAAPHLNPALTQQRYFKLSFTTADNKKNGSFQSGMWYAHFNGQYIQRQLTLKPSQKPQLLYSGKDDLQMCEIPLEQTGLLRKKGAEISMNDFDTIWQHYGGKPINEWTP